MNKIAILANGYNRKTVFGEKYYERMRKSGEVIIYDREEFDDMDYVLEFVKGSTIIVTSWGSPKIDQAILDVCPDLKLVIHAAGTVKPVITDEFIAKNIPITNSACALGEGVAETSLGFAISACKRFYWLNEDTSNKLWKDNQLGLVDFYDIKVGVISGGFVGRHMVKLLKNFHVDILMYDPTLSKEEIAEIGAVKVELNELLSECDVISVHAPSIPATDNMINKDNLKLIKDGAVLINTSRGSVIEEPALIEELSRKIILGEVPPKLMGKSLNLSTLAILINLVFWGMIWGIAGMFFSVPILVGIYIVAAQFDSTRWIAVLLSADGKIPDKNED